MHLVVIEDDRDLLELTRVVLERAGHDVSTANDGQAGLDLLREVAADAVLLDLMLPGLDGFGVLDVMRESGVSDRTPIVLVTALTSHADRRRGLEAGAVDIISKPYSPKDLMKLVDGLSGMTPAEIVDRRTRALGDLAEDESVDAPVLGDAPASRGMIRAAAEPLAGVLDLSVDAIISVDADQRIIGFNRGAETLFGYRAGELVGERLDALLPPDLVEPHRDHIRDFGRGPETSRHMGERREIHGRRRDGSLFPAEASILKNVTDGRLTFTAVLRDVSERRQLIDELERRARQQAAIAELGQQALTSTNLADFLRDVATTIRETLAVDLVEIAGLSTDESQLAVLAGAGWDDDPAGTPLAAGTGSHVGYVLDAGQAIVVADLANETRFVPSRLLSAAGVVSGVGVTIPGARRPFGALGAYTTHPRSFTADDINFLQAVANVIAALVGRARVEGRLRGYLDAAPDATLVIDAGGRVVSANPRAVDLLGHDVDALVGMQVDDLVPERLRDTHAQHREAYADAPRLRPMGAGQALSVLHADGTEVAVDIMLSPLETEEGMLVVAALRDVTERRRNEATREAFLRAVSHDLRTPLAALVGFASILAEDPSLHEEASGWVDRILFNAKRLERLLRDLLDLDRLGRGVLRPSRRPTSLEDLVHGVVGSLGLEEEITVEVDIASDASVASIDPAQVERIVENLVTNVARHTPEGTHCVVEVRRTEDGVTIAVEDDGPGVPDEIKRSIFEPFRRGDERNHSPGSGIGLSLVQRFAELHDGHAWVEDRPGGGARFVISLREL